MDPVTRIRRIAQTFEMVATPEQRRERDLVRNRVLYGQDELPPAGVDTVRPVNPQRSSSRST